MSLTGSGAEHVEVAAVVNTLGMRAGDRAFLPVDTPELQACLDLGFVRLVVDGEEQVPADQAPTAGLKQRCCGG